MRKSSADPYDAVKILAQSGQISPFAARGHDLVRADENPAGSSHPIAVAYLVPGVELRIDAKDLQPIISSLGNAICRDRMTRIFEQQKRMAQLRETRP